MTKIKLVCPYCGSDDIVRDGPLYWNIAKQEWASNDSVYDDMVCNDCDEEFEEADEREIKE
jgi:transposase-like protein